MVLDPIPQSLPVHFFGSRPQPPTSHCISAKTSRHCNTPQHAAIHCNTLQHTATHCNTLQHTKTSRQNSSLDLCRYSTISSEFKCTFHSYPFECAGDAIRWIAVVSWSQCLIMTHEKLLGIQQVSKPVHLRHRDKIQVLIFADILLLAPN